MDDDEWGRDPSVRSLRRIFAALEARQTRLLEGLGIDRFDRRIGQWRKMTLHLFEERWAGALRRGTRLEEKDVVDLYAYCLARVFGTRGIEVPPGALPVNAAIARLVEEKG